MEHGAKYNRAGFNRLAYGLQGDAPAATSAALSAGLQLSAAVQADTGGVVQINAVLQPGQVLEIDTERMEVRIDGVPVLTDCSGVGLYMRPTLTRINYLDGSTKRDLRAVITYADQYY